MNVTLGVEGSARMKSTLQELLGAVPRMGQGLTTRSPLGPVSAGEEWRGGAERERASSLSCRGAVSLIPLTAVLVKGTKVEWYLDIGSADVLNTVPRVILYTYPLPRPEACRSLVRPAVRG